MLNMVPQHKTCSLLICSNLYKYILIYIYIYIYIYILGVCWFPTFVRCIGHVALWLNMFGHVGGMSLVNFRIRNPSPNAEHIPYHQGLNIGNYKNGKSTSCTRWQVERGILSVTYKCEYKSFNFQHVNVQLFGQL